MQEALDTIYTKTRPLQHQILKEAFYKCQRAWQSNAVLKVASGKGVI